MLKDENNYGQKAKNVLKGYGKRIIMTLFPIILIIVLLAGAVYFITIDEGLYKEGDWGSTNYAASQYINGVTVGDGGKLSGSMSAQEL